MSKLESKFQSDLIKEIKLLFNGCMVLKTDPGYIQGLPDLLILYKNGWAALECKRSEGSTYRPNQEFYINMLNKMSFSRSINPGNKEEVLHELQQTFKPSRSTRVSRSE